MQDKRTAELPSRLAPMREAILLALAYWQYDAQLDARREGLLHSDLQFVIATDICGRDFHELDWQGARYTTFSKALTQLKDEGIVRCRDANAIEASLFFWEEPPVCEHCQHAHDADDPCLCSECGKPAREPGGTCGRPECIQ